MEVLKSKTLRIRTAVVAAVTAVSLSLALEAIPMSAGELSPALDDGSVPSVTVRISFPVGSAALDGSFADNGAALEQLDKLLQPKETTYNRLLEVKFVGVSSPEGGIDFNKLLSESRARAVYEYISKNYSDFSSVNTENVFIGRDWADLLALVKEDPAVPFKNEVVSILRDIVDKCETNGFEAEADNNVGRLKALESGVPYGYMQEYLFPKLRFTSLYITYEVCEVAESEPESEPEPVLALVEEEPEEFVAEAPAEEECSTCKPFYMNLNTNMLYDLALVPNIGIEFYLGRRWSIAADWMYAWWKNDHHSWYWRIYGGDLVIRKWFGKQAKENPLSGHHLGIYGQMLTYDFTLGGTGYIGDRWNWGVGLEYGYSLPITRRLNIDFALGLGYIGGKNQKYDSEDGHYYWEKTKDHHYFGPSRAEVTLVWQLGCDNYNRGKKGSGKNSGK